MKKRFSKEQIIGSLREAEAGGPSGASGPSMGSVRPRTNCTRQVMAGP